MYVDRDSKQPYQPSDDRSAYVSEESLRISQSLVASSWYPSFVPDESKQLLRSHRSGDDPSAMDLRSGDIFDDFLIRSELGRGAFGVVYLAEQLSLRRPVALKITSTRSADPSREEGQALARLDHPSIVRVYSEKFDTESGLRILCMQYVPGMTLRELMRVVWSQFGDKWSGKDLLAVLDESTTEASVVDATSIADRAKLEAASQTEAICLLGAQLASALEYAHRCGYFHRDIKPENIIVNGFGRPLLVDFNLAVQAREQSISTAGGTIPYMSPEALATLFQMRNREQQISDAGMKIDGRSDLFSLGVLLWELTCKQLPFDPATLDTKTADTDSLVHYFRKPTGAKQIPKNLNLVLLQTLAFEPSDRFVSAGELSDNLIGVSQLSGLDRQLDAFGRLGKSVIRHPAAWIIAAGLIPHVVASVLQTLYLTSVIVNTISENSQQLFEILLIWINVAIYVPAMGISIYLLHAAIGGPRNDRADIESSRNRLLKLPRSVAMIGILGWTVSATAYPTLIHIFADPLETCSHFCLSFGFASGIAVTYGYVLMSAVLVTGFYAKWQGDLARFRENSVKELSPIRNHWKRSTWLAGVIPLVAASLLVLTHNPVQGTVDSVLFKTLVNSLIAAGAIGFAVVEMAGRRVLRIIDSCIGSVADAR